MESMYVIFSRDFDYIQPAKVSDVGPFWTEQRQFRAACGAYLLPMNIALVALREGTVDYAATEALNAEKGISMPSAW